VTFRETLANNLVVSYG